MYGYHLRRRIMIHSGHVHYKKTEITDRILSVGKISLPRKNFAVNLLKTLLTKKLTTKLFVSNNIIHR